MSNIGLNKDKLELEVKDYSIDKLNKGYSDLQEEYDILNKENYKLVQENRLLKDLIVENIKEKFANSLIGGDLLKPVIKYPKVGISFYTQVILGISVIILSLGFHILYLAVTSCLMYTDGSPGCWIVSWLGIDLHASFYLYIMLYSLIAIQVILIMLIIRDKFLKKKILS